MAERLIELVVDPEEWTYDPSPGLEGLDQYQIWLWGKLRSAGFQIAPVGLNRGLGLTGKWEIEHPPAMLGSLKMTVRQWLPAEALDGGCARG